MSSEHQAEGAMLRTMIEIFLRRLDSAPVWDNDWNALILAERICDHLNAQDAALRESQPTEGARE